MDNTCSVTVLNGFDKLPDDVLHRLTIEAIRVNLKDL
jgi:hypothetical protein